jgi:hypothetical protein
MHFERPQVKLGICCGKYERLGSLNEVALLDTLHPHNGLHHGPASIHVVVTCKRYDQNLITGKGQIVLFDSTSRMSCGLTQPR